ncbi:MAG: Rid family hydrolase [Pseudomonadota bacterium]
MRQLTCCIAGMALMTGAGAAQAQDIAAEAVGAAEAAAEAALADEEAESGNIEPKISLMPENPRARAFQEQFGYADAVIHDEKVYLSGVIVVHGNDPEAAYVAVFEKLGETLERAGSGWEHVLDITSFHVDVDDSLPIMAEVKNRYVKAPFPAWTVIDIDRLYVPEGAVEIKIIAAAPDD